MIYDLRDMIHCNRNKASEINLLKKPHYAGVWQTQKPIQRARVN